MNIANLEILINHIAIDYPVAIIFAIIIFIIFRRFVIKNFLIDFLVSFIIFTIVLVFIYPILDFSTYIQPVIFINNHITQFINYLVNIILLHK